MKLIIYLASHDPVAKANNSILLRQRRQLNVEVESDNIQYVNGKLLPTEDLFKNISLFERKNVSIELIAHGNPNVRFEILVMKEESPDKYEFVTPAMLNEFFKSYASEYGLYKFSTLTLFCCSSVEYARLLSELIKGIKVISYNEDIYLDQTANPRNEDGKIVFPSVFLCGVKIGINDSDEEIVEHFKRAQIEDFSVSLENDEKTIMHKNSR